MFDEREERAVLEVLRSGNWWRFSYGQGAELAEDDVSPKSTVVRFQRAFAQAHDCRYGICTANGTVALEIALRAAGVRPGDEVIVPAYTFVATATAPLMIGAIPVFVDIDADTYNVDIHRVAQAINERTRAVIPVHFGGQPCDMEGLKALAARYGLKIIEDAAHAHGASYAGRKCGSLGDLAIFSFQLSKNMTAGEGGIITTNDEASARLCESLVWAGRMPGEPWYRHYVLAGNARLTEFQGAILQVQLERLEEQAQRRARNALVLDRLLGEIEGIEPLKILPNTTRHSYHIYIFRYQPEAFGGMPKSELVRALQAEGISGVLGGYETPLYANPMFIEKAFMGGPWPLSAWEHGQRMDYGRCSADCPVSERACAEEAVWIPQTMLLADEQAMSDIAVALRKIQTWAQAHPYRKPAHASAF
ncbi:MAG: DegT/DnrJ/EryC1/StrS family aminotransferase [Anaerolineae bacterium]